MKSFLYANMFSLVAIFFSRDNFFKCKCSLSKQDNRNYQKDLFAAVTSIKRIAVAAVSHACYEGRKILSDYNSTMTSAHGNHVTARLFSLASYMAR